ncbi:MAG TPA: acyl-ACP--UDP-N-acetylglucosamine O-acyltransferase [Candidatus Saccharimonadales bacterium]|nr:acyl-ACP--UDP-N-acetylglucosamine O-acyltransferase [Candidatus Saccharimonadales bacterium]
MTTREDLRRRIHPTAAVDPQAELAEGVQVGPYAVIGAGVRLGARTRVGPHAVLMGNLSMGEDNVVHPHAVLGDDPQDLKYRGGRTYVEIGDRNQIREFVTIHPATHEDATTRVGSDCLLMAYTHLGHDCQIGSHVIMANSSHLGGHVVVEDWAIIGGVSAVHQFTRVGRHSLVGMCSRVGKDVPPFVKVAGEPLRTAGLNSVGLIRRGFPLETRLELKRAYRILFRSHLTVREAVRRIREELHPLTEIEQLCAFVSSSQRGIVL